MTDQVLLLTPSRGLGGGIERYVETLEWALGQQEVPHSRFDLHDAGHRGRVSAHARLLARGLAHLRETGVPTRLVVAHRALLPVAAVLARQWNVSGVSLLCHGTDVWNDRARLRQRAEDRLMRRPDVRVIAVSSFTAGALAGKVPATVLPPGLSEDWFRTLVEAADLVAKPNGRMRVITAFRLAEWQGKGLPELLSAISSLRRPDIELIVCGSGKPPQQMCRIVREHSFCRLLPGLSDRELARQLADSDLFVLATRTRSGRDASGEGFGLVLLEAQVAGTPVIGPAYGGSSDAYVDRVTGVTPVDETSGGLARALEGLLRDPERLAHMSVRAAQWARESFAPESYAPLAVARLL